MKGVIAFWFFPLPEMNFCGHYKHVDLNIKNFSCLQPVWVLKLLQYYLTVQTALSQRILENDLLF